MAETIHRVGDIDICAEVHGPEDGVPLLLVMGLGAQLVSWDPEFPGALVDRGFRVVRFDNRDVGRSTHLDGQQVDLTEVFAEAAAGEPVDAPYTLSDMAADAAGLLDALGIDAAHLVGVSMGGMIVQTMAIEHPGKTLSVTSIMSTTGDPDVGQPTDEATAVLLGPAPTTEAEAIAAAFAAASVIGSPEYHDEAAIEARAAREWNRARNPAGFVRQIAAIAASASRTEALGSVDVPFTVVHGLADTLVTPSGGRRTAEAVPGATLVEIEGMGHDLPRMLWPQVIEAILATVHEAAA